MIGVVFLFCLLLNANVIEAKTDQQRSFSREVPVELKDQWMMFRFFKKMFHLSNDEGNAEGGICAGCTIATALVEQLSQIYDGNTQEVLDEICSFFPSPVSDECDQLVATFGQLLVKLIEEEQTPDQICRELLFCEDFTQCRLFPPPSKESINSLKSKIPLKRPPVPNFCWPWECIADHLPVYDDDADYFSDMFELRGYAWRGADCDDGNSEIYPGRFDSGKISPMVDHNCNGIFGVDSQGRSYEELLCGNVTTYGTIILGDSAGAHFHIPREWINSTEISRDAFINLLDIAANELDWPEMSSATGFRNSTWEGRPIGPLDSGYLRTRERNLCSHRDYQNLGVDGARSGAMASNIVKSIARNQTTDNPVMLTYALIGNDVCNSRLWDRGTTPQEFYANVLAALQYLDATLPSNSHIIFIGLIDGRILYDTVGQRIHPIGSLNSDVKYRDFYDWFNCLGISPCSGWMSSNESLRNFTSQNAAELNEVYKALLKNNTFRNFDMHYYDCPMQEIVDLWTKKMGGEAWQLIEPVDGFHPTQIADFLTVEVLTEKYANDGLLAPINPNNAQIYSLFGDQGGYDPSKKRK